MPIAGLARPRAKLPASRSFEARVTFVIGPAVAAHDTPANRGGGAENYKPLPISIWNLRFDDARDASRERIVSSLEYLVVGVLGTLRPGPCRQRSATRGKP